MPDIFISYSRKDSQQALELAERLRASGMGVWIDQRGIEAATSWSGEIADAIRAAKVFMLLLSASSTESPNVKKELGVATEVGCSLVPVELEKTELNRDFLYHLAGLQRVAIEDFEAIIRALDKLGVARAGSTAHRVEQSSPTAVGQTSPSDTRKSLMILPFEDLSPSQDNAWFTDGIASEMVNTLSNVKALKVIDWNTSSMLKNKKVRTVELAKDFSVRYFIEGQVRKSNEQIKISMNLLDIETGDHLWQDSLRGTMDDIFDIQEKCAAKVLDGLQLHLTKEEQEKVKKKPTENAEAYEMYLKGLDYYDRHTKSDLERALALFEETVRLDPRFAIAYGQIVNTCLEMYRLYSRIYSRNEAQLTRAEIAAEKVRELEGETAQYFWVMSNVASNRADSEGALLFARRTLETDPAFASGYESLGFAYNALGLREEAAKAKEEYVRLKENSKNAHFSLLVCLNEFGNEPKARERLHKAAEQAIPVFERHVRLNPDHYNAQVQFANIFRYAGRESDALAEADKLSAVEALDGAALYNLACLYLHFHQAVRGMAMLRRSVEKGFGNIEAFRRDPDLATLRDPSSPLNGEFEELVASLEVTSNE